MNPSLADFRLLPHLFVTLAAAGFIVAEENSDPFLSTSQEERETPFDAFAEVSRLEVEAAERGNPRLTLVTEFIEIPQAEWSRLSRDPDIGTEGPELRKRVGEMMKGGAATLIDMNIVSGMSGDDVLNRSFRFHIYPSEFEPPQIDEKNGRIVPAAFAATECWSTGCTVSGSAVFGKEGRVNLNFSPEVAEQSGETITGHDESEVRQPKFSIQKFDSVIEVVAGETTLAGVMHAPKPKRPDSGEAVLLVFLRADIHVPALAATITK
jgi:hypothetical protein